MIKEENRADRDTPDEKNEQDLNIFRLVRIAKGLSIGDLSEIMNISRGYISEIETGKKKPSLSYINQFSEAVGLKSSTILFFEETKDSHRLSYQKMLLLILKKICGEPDPLFN